MARCNAYHGGCSKGLAGLIECDAALAIRMAKRMYGCINFEIDTNLCQVYSFRSTAFNVHIYISCQSMFIRFLISCRTLIFTKKIVKRDFIIPEIGAVL